ncbi:MAG: DUF4886 domain-containing protein [Clostridia bacterium]|nr:DUF4886 domain-containing protein [Clostridia bacterium]
MRILSIGNSFSIDAHGYLHALAEQRGVDLSTDNLAIGGCSLQMHWENVVQGKSNYLYIINGDVWKSECASIEEVLTSEHFDVVTLQQVSHFSGLYETYQPYLNDLATYVRKHQPDARLYFHKTWAYEIDSTHSEFPLYDCNQKKMYEALCSASRLACSAIDAIAIPSGDVIQSLRERVPAFDYANGGESLCCDGFHMSHTYGRYAVALTWLATLTGKRVEPLPFMELDLGIITQICDIVNEIVFAK